nr:uncharacterized protein LOC123755099 [Procambarus clarkii]
MVLLRHQIVMAVVMMRAAPVVCEEVGESVEQMGGMLNQMGLAEGQDGEQVGVMVSQVVEHHLPSCHLVLITTTRHSTVTSTILRRLSVDGETGMVVAETGSVFSQDQQSQSNLIHGLWGIPTTTCRGLILDLSVGNSSASVLKLAEAAGLWQLRETVVVAVGGTAGVRAVLLHQTLRNTLHALYLALHVPALHATPPHTDARLGRSPGVPAPRQRVRTSGQSSQSSLAVAAWWLVVGGVERPLAGAPAGGMEVASGSRVRRVDTERLEFFGAVDWPIVEITLLDVLCVNVSDLLGLDKISPTRVAVSFATSLLYRKFVARSLPLPASAVTVEISNPWGPLTFVSVHGVPVTFPEAELMSVFTWFAAGCDVPRAEAPSVFLEDDFPRLSVRGDSLADPRSVQVPGGIPAAVLAVAPSGPDLSAPLVISVDLGAPASDLRRSVDEEVHPHPVASVVALYLRYRWIPRVCWSLPFRLLCLLCACFLPHVVEAAVLRDRAAPALGPPADGSSGAPLAGDDSSDDQRPISKRRRSARDASPRWTWAEGRDALDDDAVGPVESLMGHKLRVVTVPHFPFMDFVRSREGAGGRVTPRDALDTRLLHTFADALNFTFEIREEPELSWGLLKDDGVFTGMMGQLQREETDFCTIAGPSPERLKVIEYLRGYPSDPMTVTSLKPTLLPENLSLIRPFSGELWVALLVSVVASGATLWLLQKAWQWVSGERTVRLSSALLYSWGTLMTQTPRVPFVTNSGRMLVGWWLVFCLVITTGYRSSLVAHMTIQGKTHPIETFVDLAKQHNWKWGIEPWLLKGVPFDYFSKHPVPVIQHIYKNMEMVTREEALKKVLAGHYTLIVWENNLYITIASYYTDAYGHTPYFISRKGVSIMAAFGWGFRKGAPFYPRFHQLMSRLEDSGIISYWREEVISRRVRENRAAAALDPQGTQGHSGKEESEEVVLGLQHLQGVFYLLFLGCGIALFTLLGENLAFCRSSNQ